jgi:hypothetical protein
MENSPRREPWVTIRENPPKPRQGRRKRCLRRRRQSFSSRWALAALAWAVKKLVLGRFRLAQLLPRLQARPVLEHRDDFMRRRAVLIKCFDHYRILLGGTQAIESVTEWK